MSGEGSGAALPADRGSGGGARAVRGGAREGEPRKARATGSCGRGAPAGADCGFSTGSDTTRGATVRPSSDARGACTGAARSHRAGAGCSGGGRAGGIRGCTVDGQGGPISRSGDCTRIDLAVTDHDPNRSAGAQRGARCARSRARSSTVHAAAADPQAPETHGTATHVVRQTGLRMRAGPDADRAKIRPAKDTRRPVCFAVVRLERPGARQPIPRPAPVPLSRPIS